MIMKKTNILDVILINDLFFIIFLLNQWAWKISRCDGCETLITLVLLFKVTISASIWVIAQIGQQITAKQSFNFEPFVLI